MTNDYDTITAVVDTRLTGGKWYWEVRITAMSGMLCFGVVKVGFNTSQAYCLGADSQGNSWGLQGPNSCLYHRGMTTYKNINWCVRNRTRFACLQLHYPQLLTGTHPL